MSACRLASLNRRAAQGVLLGLILSLTSALAQLPPASPAEAGLSAERLERLSLSLQSVVDEQKAAGRGRSGRTAGEARTTRPIGSIPGSRWSAS